MNLRQFGRGGRPGLGRVGDYTDRLVYEINCRRRRTDLTLAVAGNHVLVKLVKFSEFVLAQLAVYPAYR